MRVQRILPTLLLLIPLVCSGQQSSCPNTGFENDDFTNWTGGTGWCCPISISNTNIVNGRHTIMSGPGTDPNTGNVVPVVAPGGGLFSARLGNDDTNSESERLSYSMVVDANNSLFLYRYAVVLQDPGHTTSEQPRFEIRMFDQTGALVTCGQYSVTASAGIPGFLTFIDQWGETVIYKNWTTVGMDLSSYSGQQVTIEFSTGDCSQGGHYGYAYIDCYCSPLQISSDFCPGLPTTTLEAPLGFASYLWSTGETTPTISVSNPTQGQTFSCTLTAVTGCAVTLSATLTPSLVASGYTSQGDCMNDVQFSDNSQVLSGPPIDSWQWDFGDGSPISDLQSPTHSFSTPGLHQVMLVVQSGAGCPDTLVQTLDLLPSPLVGFEYTTPCLGDAVNFNDTTVMGAAVSQLSWDFGDGSPGSSASSPSHLYALAGTYDVQLLVSDVNGCVDSLELPVTVNLHPTVNLGADQTICADQVVTLNAGNPGADFMWNTGETTQTMTPDSTSLFWVVVTLPTGCAASDTVSITFNPLPEVDLQDTTLCVEQSLVLDAGNPGCTYLWTNAQTTQTITLTGTSGNIGVTVTSSAGCVDGDNALVTFIPSVATDLGPDQLLCDLEQAVLDAGVFPNAQYLWSDGSTGQQYIATETADIWVEVTNGYCSSADTIGLVFGPLPVFSLSDTSLCIEEAVTLDAGNPDCTFLWSTGETSQSIVVQEFSGSYGVIATTPLQCIDSTRVEVTFIPSIVLELGADTILCRGEVMVYDAENPNSTYLWSEGSTSAQVSIADPMTLAVHVSNGYCEGRDTVRIDVIEFPLHAQVSVVDTCFEDPLVEVTLPGSPAADSYLWSTGETTPTIIVDDYGLYVVEALNDPRCYTTDTIVVREMCPPRVFIPNSFTPNGDGVNDVFLPVGYNVLTLELLVFDRWGELVFRSEEHGQGWDGSLGGGYVPDGVYNYRYTYAPFVNLAGTLGTGNTLVGHVNLLR